MQSWSIWGNVFFPEPEYVARSVSKTCSQKHCYNSSQTRRLIMLKAVIYLYPSVVPSIHTAQCQRVYGGVY